MNKAIDNKIQEHDLKIQEHDIKIASILKVLDKTEQTLSKAVETFSKSTNNEKRIIDLTKEVAKAYKMINDIREDTHNSLDSIRADVQDLSNTIKPISEDYSKARWLVISSVIIALLSGVVIPLVRG